MRPIFLLFTFFITLLSVQAQITIERADLLLSLGDTNHYQLIANTNTYDFPSEGPNQIWDYSHLATTSSTFYNQYPEGSNTDVPSANIVLIDSVLGDFPAIDILFHYEWYEQLNEDGYALVGRLLHPKQVGLGSLTTNPNDSINYLTSLSVYEDPFYKIKFPLNYNDSWSGSYTIQDNFLLSLPTFGVNPTHGTTSINSDFETQVAGWGTLILPNPLSDENYELEALLIKEQKSSITVWTLGGAPAPPVLLDAFSLEQNEENTSVSYRFLIKGVPGVMMYFSGDQSVERVSILSNWEQHITSTQELEALRQAFKTYPNPLKAGAILSFETTASFTNATIDFFDDQGRLAYKTNYAPSIQLPSHLNTGMYYYKIKDENNRPIGLGQIVIE